MKADAPPVVFVLDIDPGPTRDALAAAGYQVSASSSWSDVGRDLLRLRGQGRAKLVCDLELPGIRGVDFCRSVLKYDPDLHVVLYSEAESAALQTASRSLGCVSWAQKRDGVEKLISVLQEPRLTNVVKATGEGPSAFLLGRSLGAPVKIGLQQITIGRHAKRDVVLNDEQVSRRHCSLVRRGTGVEIADLGSRNGTFVDGRKLSESVLVGDDVRVCLGTLELELRFNLTQEEANEASWPCADTAQGPRRVDSRATTQPILGGRARALKS